MTIKITPHKHEALIRQEAEIRIRRESHLWDCKYDASNNDVALSCERPSFFEGHTYELIPAVSHPHYGLWHEWQELVKSGAVERGEAWMEWLHLGEWKNAATMPHHKPEGCMWRADTEYRIMRKEPKLKLIDWAKMPKGVMTTLGEIVRPGRGYGTSCVLSETTTPSVVTFWHPYGSLRLAPADQQPWILWMGGECPVPEGVMTHVILRNTNRVVLTKPGQHHWQHDGTDNDFIAYRITGLAPGWTDEPEKAK